MENNLFDENFISEKQMNTFVLASSFALSSALTAAFSFPAIFPFHALAKIISFAFAAVFTFPLAFEVLHKSSHECIAEGIFSTFSFALVEVVALAFSFAEVAPLTELAAFARALCQLQLQRMGSLGLVTGVVGVRGMRGGGWVTFG